jgi:hypothetical protein
MKMRKKILSETFAIKGFVDDVSKIDNKVLTNHILSNNTKDTKRSQNKDDVNYYYHNIQYHTQFTWVLQYFLDHYTAENKERLNCIDSSVIILDKNEELPLHNHFKKDDIQHTPDITFMYCVNPSNGKSEFVLNYDNHRIKDQKITTVFENKKFVVFNSTNSHMITKNTGDNFLIIKVYHFQII